MAAIIDTAIIDTDWARIWAHAWLDSNFRKTLRENPASAVMDFQKLSTPPLKPHTKIFDLDKIYGDLDAMGLSFVAMPPAELEEIAAYGTWRGLPFCLQPNEWVIVP